jgi:threonylcarbamoyladenosine tRNA methylthiotransferase MtaB
VASFYVENFGCRATQADGAAIEHQLATQGLTRSSTVESAEIVVLNTCTVTSSADQDARAAIRRIHRSNPTAQILVTGCYAQRAPDELSSIKGVSLVVGNSHKHRLGELAAGSGLLAPESLLGGPHTPSVGICGDEEAIGAPLLPSLGRSGKDEVHAPILVDDIFAHTELLAAPVFDADHEKTRPNLKVQDGCNNRCSFCVIPYVRGRSRSLPVDKVLRNVELLVANGYKELVLSGINLGRWGRDLNTGGARDRFVDLLRTILERTTVPLLRISSVEPMDWSDELIALAAGEPRIAKHAHVPLQSGSDRVLRRMHRRYRPWHYEDRIRRIHAAMPEAAIGADVMVGFPGETDEDFDETRALIERLPFTYLHVFTYSSRPGTPSAAMPDQVPVHRARERNRILRELAAAKKREFQEQFVGKTLQAITLTHRDHQIPGGRTEALTDNYQKLWLAGELEANRMITARIRSIEGEALVGNIE